MQDEMTIRQTLDDASEDPDRLRHTISTLMQDGGNTARTVTKWLNENPAALGCRPTTLCSSRAQLFSKKGDPYADLVEASARAKLN